MSHYSEQYEEDLKQQEKERKEFLLKEIEEGLKNLNNSELYKIETLIKNIKKLEGVFNILKELFH